MTINDLPGSNQEELRKILQDDILRLYHAGSLGKELGEYVESGLRDEEVLVRYDNEGCWDAKIIEEYLIRWKIENKIN